MRKIFRSKELAASRSQNGPDAPPEIHSQLSKIAVILQIMLFRLGYPN